MGEPTDFEEKAIDAEALAAAAVHPLVRLTFEVLARDYWRQAKQVTLAISAHDPPREAKL
jgi:hypothetical protein